MSESHPVGAPLEAHLESESESGAEEQPQEVGEGSQDATTTATEKTKKKKKRSKRSKLVSALKGEKLSEPAESSKSPSKLPDEAVKKLLEMNPSLKGELAGIPPEKASEILRKMDVSQLLSGISLNGKNQKDMASYKFWATQPVPKFDEKPEDSRPDGPIKEVTPEMVPKTAAPLPEGYEWCELDLTNDEEIKEVYKLLSQHYVEDDHAMFRFNYSAVFLDWALKSPGWKKSWHIGVRAKGPSRLLVASIFGIPIKLRIRQNVLDVVEINFLCVHKKLRSRRLAPVLIKEITRRCNLDGVYQAIYTGGVVLPTPVGSCRYFHRSLDWSKLYEIGFSPLPPNSTPAKMIARNQLPSNTSTPGWRVMEERDIEPVYDLLSRYLTRFELAQEFTRDEVEHWFINKHKPEDQVVWSFVAEQDGKITDFGSFYCLESSVIGEMSKKHDKIRAAYLYYYASEHAFNPKEKGLKERLTQLVQDLLIEAKKAKFDVFNALTLHDNPLFLEQLKFGAGDGQLHHYLYNWRTKPISGGINAKNQPDESKRGGIGIVLL
ncbi:glycylpeptide N-tetradecanoyltransferase [Capronia coronata CBS 617.96]|uniref:Glycylpeptide N-tetradecanoyltransferase n=1 Tax=Capronia coronata CBS 617.96 TaxID=1182541 RepID=W9ZN91_9EURO|nr:glycylpeptide N-tetradecanoyltransferase [Capronia coronata CBS 617.96]EXJ95939.1 glycylpeptide N-tetradecanoyltransferase [Capronia coronata CBS 617.96]